MSKEFRDRLDDLASLEDGWTEYGSGLDKELLAFLRESVPGLVKKAGVPFPHVFPTMEGGVQLEWVLGDWEIEFLYLANRLDLEIFGLNTSTQETFDFDTFRADEKLQVDVLMLRFRDAE